MNMKKLTMIAVLVLAVWMPGHAQSQGDRLDFTHNRITIGGGAAYTPTHIPKDYYQRHAKGSSSLELSLDYAHLWDLAEHHALGFEINGYQSHLDRNGCNIFYGGASVVYNFRTDNGWVFSASEGMGYAGNDFDEGLHDRWDEGGIGVYSKIGAHYKLTKHLGIGAEARLLGSFFRVQYDDGGDDVKEIVQSGISAQLRWYF